ncbi:MAG: hypothetical protein KKA07_06210 [Bacteroidetes bacterium]|nr:hypothetical protein [Bacteroidota bacterium]MBU1718648.1 hypothetical protein [Bacteroidota bacterium]
MNALLLYTIEASASLIVLYGIYAIFLSRDSFFKVNRLYLLASLLFSMAIPLFRIPLSTGGDSGTYSQMLDTIVVGSSQVKATIDSGSIRRSGCFVHQ